jgi:hypothetical protein
LEDLGLIIIREEKVVRKTYYISLTEKGRMVAEHLKKAEAIANTPSIEVMERDEPELTMTNEEAEMAKRLTILFHINVVDDYITAEEVKPDRPQRIFNIYVKRNWNGEFRLWCEHDDSYDCWHVRAGWGYPHVQRMMMHYREKIMVCPVCGNDNRESANYSDNCGVKLE